MYRKGTLLVYVICLIRVVLLGVLPVLAILHIYVFSLHPIRRYWHNTLVTKGGDPSIVFPASHTGEIDSVPPSPR